MARSCGQSLLRLPTHSKHSCPSVAQSTISTKREKTAASLFRDAPNPSRLWLVRRFEFYLPVLDRHRAGCGRHPCIRGRSESLGILSL